MLPILPIDVINKILEYAPSHREKFNKCMPQIIWAKVKKAYLNMLMHNYGYELCNPYQLAMQLTTQTEFDKYFGEAYMRYINKKTAHTRRYYKFTHRVQ